MFVRSIVELGEHSVFAAGLRRGGSVLDAGANRGRFGTELSNHFSVDVIYVEANPVLAAALREKCLNIVECALGDRDGSQVFNIGDNDEASSLRKPAGEGSHLTIKNSVLVDVRTIQTIMTTFGVTQFTCVKLDIEGAEVEVMGALIARAAEISPQWTVEFHDDDAFKMCSPAEVNAIIGKMRSAGFSILIRDSPRRTNVLFVHRGALSIGKLHWFVIRLRYQYVARLWRYLHGL